VIHVIFSLTLNSVIRGKVNLQCYCGILKLNIQCHEAYLCQQSAAVTTYYCATHTRSIATDLLSGSVVRRVLLSPDLADQWNTSLLRVCHV
jgi:hypothetical protein